MNEIIAEIRRHDEFVVIAHVHPDGDALGSAVAMYLMLKNMGKKAFVCIEGNFPKKMEIVTQYCGDFIEPSESVFPCAIALDCGDTTRLGAASPLFYAAETRIVIDHHHTNMGYGDFNLVRSYSATGLILFELMGRMGYDIDAKTANCLYVAISTDTGNFSYEATDEATLACAAKLRKAGADIPLICEVMYKNRSYPETKLTGVAIDRIELFGNGRIALTYVLQSDYDALGAVKEDCDDLINYAREIDGVEVAVFLRQIDGGKFKLSLRSRSCVDVSRIAAGFHGGGHIRAAGGTMEGTLKDCSACIVKAVMEEINK